MKRIKFLDNVSLKTKLLSVFMVIILIPILMLGFMTYYTTSSVLYDQVEQLMGDQSYIIQQSIKNIYDESLNRLDSDLMVSKDIFDEGIPYLDNEDSMDISAINQITNEEIQLTIPRMKMVESSVAFNYESVDLIKSLVGDVATVFQIIPNGLLRISTNVLNDGIRDVGTYIPNDSPEYQAIMNGEAYIGRTLVQDSWYLSVYDPILDSENNIIGALFIGVSESQYQEALKENFKTIVIGKTGYIFILDGEGEYVLSKDRARDGENIYGAKDADGNLFIQEMVKITTNLDFGQTNILYYPWQNAGESAAKMKFAANSYFKEWDWVIGASAYVEDFQEPLSKIRQNTILIGLLGLILSSIVAYLVGGLLTTPLLKLTTAFDRMANQDYTQKDNLELTKDEYGRLAKTYYSLFDGNRDLLLNIQQAMEKVSMISEKLSSSSEEVNASTMQVAETIQQIAKGSQNQSGLVESTAKVVKDLNISIESISTNLSKVSESANRATTNAMRGKQAAGLASANMDNIKHSVSNVGTVIGELGDKSAQIGNIVDVINGISEQTNLLALNAAIEAARAGEAGKGFAVVSDEIRKLAEESQKATHQISGLVEGIQAAAKAAVVSTDKGIKEVDEGTIVVGDALVALEGISAIIENVGSQVGSVVSESTQQATLTDKVNRAMSEVSTVAEQSAAGGQEVSASVEETTSAMQEVAGNAQELAKAAEDLNKMIETFKLA